MYIVQGQQAESEDLVGDVEVAQIGAGEARAGGAIAAFVEGALVVPELGPLDVEASVGGENRAVAAHARRRHAVEQVYAAPDAFDEVLGKPDAHEVARAGLWRGRRGRRRASRTWPALASPTESPPMPKPFQSCIADRRGGFAAKVGVNAALHDGKERLLADCSAGLCASAPLERLDGSARAIEGSARSRRARRCDSDCPGMT